MVTATDKQAPGSGRTLAILVSSDRHLEHVIGLTAAAHAKSSRVLLFFTGRGVRLTMAPDFQKLAGKASITICDTSFRACGLHDKVHQVPGVQASGFTTQSRFAELLDRADRHLVF